MYKQVKNILTKQMNKNGLEFIVKVGSDNFDNLYDDNGVPISIDTVTPIIKVNNVVVDLSTLSNYKEVVFPGIEALTNEIVSDTPIVNHNSIAIDIDTIDISPLVFKIKGFHKYDRMYKEDEAVPYTKNELIEIALPLNVLTKKIRKNDILETASEKYRVVKEYNIGDVWRGLEIEREY